jgi:hypothetical protein
MVNDSQNLQKLFRLVEVTLANQARRELRKVNDVTEVTQRDLLVLNDAKREKQDMEKCIHELSAENDRLESINEELSEVLAEIASPCNQADVDAAGCLARAALRKREEK